MSTDLPEEIFLDLSLECNLKCISCDIHMADKPTNGLSLEDKKEIVQQIGDIEKDIPLVFTGGEPFERRDLLYPLAKECKKIDIYSTISTNGTLLNEEDIERLPRSGINDVVVSLDSHDPSIHDKIRGVEGIHSRAVKNIKRLVKAKERYDVEFHVMISTILGSHNLDKIPELVDLGKSLDIDDIIFQPIQPVFDRDEEDKWWEQNPLFPTSEQVEKGIADLKNLKEENAPLFQSNKQFSDMEYYFKNQGEVRKNTCVSPRKNMMIDVVGHVRSCFNMEKIGLEPIGHVKEKSLKEFWNSSEKIREGMKDCTECCGVMVCHAR